MSLLDDEDKIFVNAKEQIKASISKFIDDNFKVISKYTISKEPNDDGRYVVDCSGDIIVKNKSITSLTNGRFVWGEVKGNFSCYYCKSLTTLEGAPEKVGGYFDCNHCNSLVTLEGAPKDVGGNFSCMGCKSLKSLKWSPKEIKSNFYCNNCDSLKTLEGAPEKVGSDFNCNHCKSLTSLEGAPEKVGRDFYCMKCASLKSYNVDSIIKGKFKY